MIGQHRSAIGIVVERTSRYALLVHLPRLAGYGTIRPVKNRPALGGYGAIAMKDALQATMHTMHAELLRSPTWDRGKSRPRTCSSRSTLVSPSTSLTRTRPGNAALMRTPTVAVD